MTAIGAATETLSVIRRVVLWNGAAQTVVYASGNDPWSHFVRANVMACFLSIGTGLDGGLTARTRRVCKGRK